MSRIGISSHRGPQAPATPPTPAGAPAAAPAAAPATAPTGVVATTGANDAVLAKPFEWLLRNSVWPVDPAGIWGNLANRQIDTTSPITPNDYKVVAAHNRICYGNFVESGNLHTAGGAFLLNVNTSQQLNNAEKLARVPFWYLAWKSGYMTELTIPDARPVPPGKKHPGPWNKGPRTIGVGVDFDPYLCFTTGISGCSVFVHGSVFSPTIEHAGQDGWGSTTKTDVQHWEDMFTQRHGGQVANQSSAHVNKSHYVSNMRVNISTAAGEVMPFKSTIHAERYCRYVKDQQGVQVIDGQPYGCVFGIRGEDRSWEFYLQENVRITYKLPNGMTKTAQRPMIVSRIFPGRGFTYLAKFKDATPLPMT